MVLSQPLSDEQLSVLRRTCAVIDAKDLPDEECAICYAYRRDEGGGDAGGDGTAGGAGART